VVVEQGDQLGDLRRAGAVGQHAVDQLPHIAAQRRQGLHTAGMADGARQVHQVDTLQAEQVALGNHPAKPLMLNQADVGDMPLGHGNRRIEGAGIRRQMEGRLGHQTVDGLRQVDAIGHHAAQVAQGKDAQRF
jgi:hypothetical protein